MIKKKLSKQENLTSIQSYSYGTYKPCHLYIVQKEGPGLTFQSTAHFTDKAQGLFVVASATGAFHEGITASTILILSTLYVIRVSFLISNTRRVRRVALCYQKERKKGTAFYCLILSYLNRTSVFFLPSSSSDTVVVYPDGTQQR